MALAEVKRQKEAAEKLATDEGQRAERLAQDVDQLQRELANRATENGASLSLEGRQAT